MSTKKQVEQRGAKDPFKRVVIRGITYRPICIASSIGRRSLRGVLNSSCNLFIQHTSGKLQHSMLCSAHHESPPNLDPLLQRYGPPLLLRGCSCIDDGIELLVIWVLASDVGLLVVGADGGLHDSTDRCCKAISAPER